MVDKYADLPENQKQQHFDKLNAYKDSLRKNPQLTMLFLEMTLACNQRCLHCGSNCGEHVLKNALTDYEILEMMISLKYSMEKNGEKLPFVGVTGGEPMLRPHLPRLMKSIRQLGYHWGMTSNGSLITKEQAKELRMAGMYSISISLDGLKETHDWFRQTTGAYALALQSVDNLIEANIPKVMITTVVHKRNIHELDEIYKVVKSHGCKMWRIINVEPIGRALTNPELMLDREDYQYIIDYIIRHQADEGMEIIYSCNHYLGLERERKTRPWYYNCRAGIQVASIQYNGDISACLDIERRPELTYGNIRENDFYYVWKTRFEAYRRHKEEDSKKCSVCRHKENCQGGGYHTWDFDNNEPRLCMLSQLEDL